MLINHDALHSLQIFEDETHANVHQKNKKEGLSLYGKRPILSLDSSVKRLRPDFLGMLCRTRSPMGKAMLKRWLQQPSLEIPVLEARFDAVDCLSRVENRTSSSSLFLQGMAELPRTVHISGSLHKIMNVKNVGRALKALQQNQNPVQQWQAIEGVSETSLLGIQARH
jgi:DNA mismatch repair ATPase MutS